MGVWWTGETRQYVLNGHAVSVVLLSEALGKVSSRSPVLVAKRPVGYYVYRVLQKLASSSCLRVHRELPQYVLFTQKTGLKQRMLCGAVDWVVELAGRGLRAGVEVTHHQSRKRGQGEESCRPTNTRRTQVAGRRTEVCGRKRAPVVAGGGEGKGAAGLAEGEVVTRAARAEGGCR